MKKFWSDFKEFAMKGNIIDMAVGVVIGGAFGKIVSSFVADIITPLIGILLGKVSFADLKWVISPAVLDEVSGEVVKAEAALTYGNFIQNIIDFLITALSIFIFLRIIMSVKKRFEEAKNSFVKSDEKAAEEAAAEAAPAPAEPSDEIKLLSEIRDLLKNKDADGE